MEPYVAFLDNAILEGATPWERSLEGQTQSTIPMMTQVAPTEEPTKEPAPAEVSTEEPALTEEPTKELAPAEASMEEVAPMEEPDEEPATLMAMVSGPAGGARYPPCVGTRRKIRERCPVAFPWLDGGAASCPVSDPHWTNPSNSW